MRRQEGEDRRKGTAYGNWGLTLPDYADGSCKLRIYVVSSGRNGTPRRRVMLCKCGLNSPAGLFFNHEATVFSIGSRNRLAVSIQDDSLHLVIIEKANS